MRTLVVTILVAASFVFAGCSGSPTAESSPTPSYAFVGDSGSLALPSETLADWVGYADAVVVVEVVDEVAIEEEEAMPGGSGLILRRLSLSITKTLWQRLPEFDVPTSASNRAWGWVVREGVKRPMVDRGGSRREVGHTYVMGLTTTGTGPGWTSIGPGAVLPFDTGIAGEGERVGADPKDPLAGTSQAYQDLLGKSADQIAQILGSTEPDPFAVKYADLPAVERYEKAALDAASQPSPAPATK